MAAKQQAVQAAPVTREEALEAVALDLTKALCRIDPQVYGAFGDADVILGGKVAAKLKQLEAEAGG